MGKKRQQYDGGHYSRRGYSKQDLYKGPEPQGYAGLDRHALYESAVQSPKGDISYLLCFYHRYIGQQVPEHLREDFCGTALLASTWCRGDIARRTGMGLDIDRDALSWGMQHNGEGLTDTPQPCLWLLHGDVTQPLEKAVLVNCPVSSHSSDGGDSSQPSVEQSVQDMSINATGAAANGLNCSSGRQLDTASTEQAPITDAVHSSNNNEHRDSAQASSVSVPLSDHSRSGLQAKPLHQRSTEHPTGYPQEGNLMHHGSGSNGAHLSCSSRDRAEGCRAADIICAFNFSVCLLHKRSEVQAYFRQSRQALSRRGGILVMDLLGGHAAEESLLMHRHNDTTGARFVWEQEKFNPVTRHIDCYITLRDPDTQKNLRRAFHYHWRLWTIPELHDMLMGADFSRVYVWLRPMQGVTSGCEDEDGGDGSSDSGEREEDFEEYDANTFSAKTAEMLSKGWTAFIVGVAEPC